MRRLEKLELTMRTANFVFGILLVACTACDMMPSRPVKLDVPPEPVGDEIAACGHFVHTGAPVVLWSAAPYYNAYPLVPDPKRQIPAPDSATTSERASQASGAERALNATSPSSSLSSSSRGEHDTLTSGDGREPLQPGGGPALVTAYQPGRMLKSADGSVRARVEPDCADVAELAGVVDQLVLHFDVCGVSRSCFQVLRDRALSVHFLLDVDGTIYQTLDLREQAYHATKANARSIGIEIANLGAYPPSDHPVLDEWYKRDFEGPYIVLPERLQDGGVRIPGFVARPARTELVHGEIQGQDLVQYDFTPEQYESLEKLTVALCRMFPKIAPDAPRDAAGAVRKEALSDDEFAAFHGILGHYHVQKNKNDPGPAFDWETFLARVKTGLAKTTEAAP
jgi:N-acetyl-anhydromuramyl-L-alanine amidase AmpD